VYAPEKFHRDWASEHANALQTGLIGDLGWS